ncbi:hypothetical protein FOZ60_012624, partial [Perkinsus olseni]
MERMPFGLSNAPARFQKGMDRILADLPFVKVYLDDILVFSPDPETHLEHLRIVFQRLARYNLTLSAEKCAFGMPEVEYLAHVFDGEGMRPAINKVEAITKWPAPQNVVELRSFLGLAGYYREFIPDFSDHARPLQRILTLCKNDDPKLEDTWSDEHEASFYELKAALAILPYLAYPDFDQPFQLCTDASDYAIGGVLEQNGRPVGYYSQALSGSQLNWPVYEKEAYALLKSLLHFEHFILGYPLEVICFSDHRPLSWIKKSCSPK